MPSHIAVIPGRKWSKGFPRKNRLFFRKTAEFIRDVGLYERVIVTSDDEVLLGLAEEHGFETLPRPPELSKDDTPIKMVFKHVVETCSIKGADYLWLFYIPLLYRNKKDYIAAKELAEKAQPESLSAFIPAKTHPFNCWRHDVQTKQLKKFIENEVFNRQDLPDAWENYHYLYCCRGESIDRLDNNLLSANTLPIFLPKETASKLVEIDTPADLETWKQLHPQDYLLWEKLHPFEDIPDGQ